MVFTKALLDWAIDKLSCSGICGDARREAIYLFSKAVGLQEQSFLYLQDKVDINFAINFAEYIYLRAQKRPIEYILGEVNFMGLLIKVHYGVFIPRAETEQLVELVSEHMKGHKKKVVVDVGTGSGAIAIALAKTHKNATFIATDINPVALNLALANAKLHRCASRIKFIRSNLLSGIQGDKKVDIIIANLPYLSIEDYLSRPGELDYEPRNALFASMRLYEKLFIQARHLLRVGGMLFAEINYRYVDEYVSKVSQLFRKFKVQSDSLGINRFIVAWR